MAEAYHELRSLRGRDRLDPIDAGGSLALIVLRHPSHGERPGSARLQEETLQTVDCLDVATAGGSIDPSLQAVHLPLQLPPGDGTPVLDWRGPRHHFRFDPRLQPYPPSDRARVSLSRALPRAFASRAIPPPTGIR